MIRSASAQLGSSAQLKQAAKAAPIAEGCHSDEPHVAAGLASSGRGLPISVVRGRVAETVVVLAAFCFELLAPGAAFGDLALLTLLGVGSERVERFPCRFDELVADFDHRSGDPYVACVLVRTGDSHAVQIGTRRAHRISSGASAACPRAA